jgi:hypothetical protein
MNSYKFINILWEEKKLQYGLHGYPSVTPVQFNIYKQCTPLFSGIPAHVPQPSSMEPQEFSVLTLGRNNKNLKIYDECSYNAHHRLQVLMLHEH